MVEERSDEDKWPPPIHRRGINVLQVRTKNENAARLSKDGDRTPSYHFFCNIAKMIKVSNYLITTDLYLSKLSL